MEHTLMKIERIILGGLLVIMLGMCLPGSAHAQAVSGSILGTVTDQSGASIPNAQIEITDVERGTAYQQTTNASGNYVQGRLLAGQYKVKVSAPGFSEVVAPAVVQVGAATRVDISLQVGKASTQVTVAGKTPVLQVDRASVNTTMTSHELEQLPVLGRNVTSLILTVPGAYTNSWSVASDENPNGGLQINVNGQNFSGNGFMLDGTNNQTALLGIAIINPNIDSLQEFKVTTSNYDAEFGNVTAALVQATTKSGTNQYHGSAFEYLRNDVFDSADPFTQLKPPIRWNQFGGSLGGPIKRNKLFFFADYQGTRQRNGGSVLTTVPTVAERGGNLQALLGSYICADGSVSAAPCGSPYMVPTTEGGTIAARAGMIFDPTTGNPDGTGRVAITTGGQANIIPVPQQISNILGYLPAPNVGAQGQIFNNYVGSGSEIYDTNQPDVRIDYNISPKATMFGRYSLADYTIQAPAAFGTVAGGPAMNGLNFAGQSLDRNQSVALGFDYVFTSSLVGEFRFGAYRQRIRVEPFGVGTEPASQAGLPGLNLGTTETSGMPAFYINGDGGFNFGYSLGVNDCNCPLKETQNQFEWITNWTKMHGNHNIKWGGEIVRDQQQRIPSDEHRSGEIGFSESVTGNATVDALASGLATTGSGLGSFMLGAPSSFGRYFNGIGYYPGLRQTRIFLYGEDTWRVTRKLTLDLGLRYENYRPQSAAKPGGMSTFDPTTGLVSVAGVGPVPLNTGVQPYNTGFLPRFGIAYQIQSNTVIRAGYAWSYTSSAFGSIFGQGAEYNPPGLIPQSVSQVTPYSPAFNLFTGPPLPANPPVSSSGTFPLPNGLNMYNWFYPLNAYRIPQAYLWNFTVQHEFADRFSLQVAYVGNVGRHLYANPNINQAVPGPGSFDSRRPFYPNFGLQQGIYYTCNCDNSNYNSLQVTLQRHATRNLDFVLNYTYSKTMDSTEAGGGGFDNNYNWAASYGPASWDHTHAVTLTNVWAIPYGHGQRWGSSGGKVAQALLGGWNLNGVTTLVSGGPFSPMVANTASVNADFNGVRADKIGDPSVSNQSAAMWFNPAAYTLPQQPYRDGTASRNSLRGPAAYSFDLSLDKTFVIAEGKTLEFRWSNFNAFNIDNYGLPNNTIDVSGAGQITYTQLPMRRMQFGLHFRF